jgi:vacuolar-type H+-ATPase subunit F/Vma7
MNKLTLSLLLFLNFVNLYAQPDGDKILKEGQLLYRLEKASWYGTDFLFDRFPNKRNQIGGYLSYQGDNNKIFTIFFERNFTSHVLVRFQFDSLPKQKPIGIDTINLIANQTESDLIQIRQDALEKINTNSDKFFSFYKNTSYNIIPVITQTERKVYSITGPQTSGVVLIGNDYLFKYDSENNFISKEKIHNTLIQLPAKMDSARNAIATMHSHVISGIIDPTDICTLLLYRDFVEWKQHYVISSKYVSIFDLNKEELVIMKKKDWEKIYKNNK